MDTDRTCRRSPVRFSAGAGEASARGERGFMLLVVASLLFSLTLVSLLALTSARSGFYRAVDLERHMQATYLAEAGINHAISLIYAVDDVSALELPFVLLPTTILGEGSYSVELLNNPTDPGGARDTDGVVVIRSTGYSRGQTNRRTVESYVLVETGDLSIPAALSLGSGLTGILTGNATISGDDVDGVQSTIGGVAFESTGQSLSTGGSATVDGLPDYSWASSAFTSGSVAATAEAMIDSLASSSSAVHLSGSLSGTAGTVASPQVTVVDAGTSLSASGTVSGAGILIIRGDFEAAGQFSFSGLVLIEGSTGSLTLRGQASILGGVAASASSSGGSGNCGGDDDDDDDDHDNGDDDHGGGHDDDDDHGSGDDDCDDHGDKGHSGGSDQKTGSGAEDKGGNSGHDQDDDDGGHDGDDDEDDDDGGHGGGHDGDDDEDDDDDGGHGGGHDGDDDGGHGGGNAGEDDCGSRSVITLAGTSRIQYSPTQLTTASSLTSSVTVRSYTARN